MYLKQLDIVGFKSFADRTRLTFEPGMIAIVGPNGCGKSNVSDAIRWVLGEQRPTALRCGKLVDVVFNGTDSRKPLGLAEVSITFADCEALLGTEYHEVTVTRRVYRSGEGEYFINKTACRLKDVQRLFMGTGIGTTSYSVMAQGQIDQILSSKPEDRRAVFEEAAGITKFKADRKEAIRKIEQTEQNLLREADVLREMKRQIGSLQRQVGKAKRYKELRDELRGVDIFVSKGKIKGFDDALEANAREQAETEHAIAVATTEVADAEELARNLHAEIHAIEEKLNALASEAAAADGACKRAEEVISVNAQRVAEYQSFSERDGREIAATKQLLDEVKMQSESLEQKAALLTGGVQAAKQALAEADRVFRASSLRIDKLRETLQSTRAESARCDRRVAEARDAIARVEHAAREAMLKKERLTSEEAQLKDSVSRIAATREEVAGRLEAAKKTESEAAQALAQVEEARAAHQRELEDLRENFGKMQADAAAKEAQLAYLRDAEKSADAFAAGAKILLEKKAGLPEDVVVGPLADMFDAPAEYRLALESALRSWLDAVIIKDAAAAEVAVSALLSKKAGSARLIPLSAVFQGAVPAGERLIDKITVEANFKAAAEALIGDVIIGDKPVAGTRAVTLEGVLRRADGTVEVWQPGKAAASPLSRRMLVKETKTALAALTEKIEKGRTTLANGAARTAELDAAIGQARHTLSDARRAAAEAQGELTGIDRDAVNLANRLKSTTAELERVKEATAGDEAKRAELTKSIEENVAKRDALMNELTARQEELQQCEIANAEESRVLTERRIAAGKMESELAFTSQQKEDTAKRQAELMRTIEGRETGIRGYEESVARLQAESEKLKAEIPALREKAQGVHAETEKMRAARAERTEKLTAADATTGVKRQTLDDARALKGRLEVAQTEATMRRQNVYDHLNQEYGLDAISAMREPDPEWKGGQIPPTEALEAQVNRLNAEIAALGPVNLVAIDEFRELEERYTKEKEQEADLLSAKEKVMALITDLNTKSGELFKQTFEQANTNFQKMFTKLFNGGEAKLVLLENAEDPLESGIDIIARPPGKRPQSVTLLSGGERTMTAVALLFAIFRIKPAPFTMLDELDAALDDANIGRFVDALKEFLDRSQFLIITHNQHTIAGSDLVYGVSQQEKGISRIISMRLSDVGVKEKEKQQKDN